VLTIGGGGKDQDYYQYEGAELVIELRPAENPVPGVDYDQLVVTGTAYLQSGTMVRIVPAPGVYRNLGRYTIIDGVVHADDLSAINVEIGTGGALFLAGQLEEGSPTLVLEPKPFESAAATVNQKAVAAVLTATVDEPGSDLGEVHEWLFSLGPSDVDKLHAALNSLSGEVYAALPTLASRRLEGMVAGAHHSLAESGEPGRQVWAVAQGGAGRISGNPVHGTTATDFQLRGVTVGVDLLHRDGTRASVLAGSLTETLTMEERQSTLQGTTVQLGAYGQWVLGSVTLRGVVGFSSTRTESARQVAVGDTLWTAEGSFATTDAAMVLEARSDAWSNEQVQLVPVVSLGWYATQRAGFEETGAGGLGLTVDDHNAAWIRGRVGLEVAPAPAAAEEKPRPAPLSSAAPLRSTKSPSTRCSPTIWPAGCRGVGRRGRAAGIRDDKQSRRPGAGPLLCCLLLVYDVASHLLPIGYLGRIVAYDPREALGAVPGANHFFQQSDFCERATEALWAEGFWGAFGHEAFWTWVRGEVDRRTQVQVTAIPSRNAWPSP